MGDYPLVFDPTRFPDIPPPVPANDGLLSGDLRAKAPVEVQGTLRIAKPKDAFVEKVWIQEVANSENRSLLWSAGADNDLRSVLGPDQHFHFLPGIDPVEIRWKVSSIKKITKAKFEIWSAAEPNRAIWTKEYQGAEAQKILSGEDQKGSGPLAWSEVVVSGDAQRFPDQIPNLAHAPYQLRLTVTSESGRVSTAWTYFDILVDSIELHWGDQSLIPTGNIQDVLPVYQPLTDRDEKALLAWLKQPDMTQPENTRIHGTNPIELLLRSTNCAYVHLQEWYSWRDFSFLRYQGRWGDGPRIPIVAKVFMKSLKGDAVHSAAAARALGPARFLWDWHDQTEAERRNELAGANAQTTAFIMAALKYKENIAGEPANCLNSHIDRGGKRGSTARVLPEFNSTAVLPFAVSKATTRTWAVFSKAQTQGTWACCTGIIFQPSRMAKDTYKLRVFLAPGSHAATLDVAGTMDTLVGNHPGLPTATTGMMEVLRRIDARYVRKSPTMASMDLNQISQAYAIGGVKIVWTQQTWTKGDFDRYLGEALAPDNAGENNTFTRNKCYGPNARARRKSLATWAAGNVGTKLNIYDQWFGRKKGGPTPPQPSEANFTLPSRDEVEAILIDPVVKLYIEKGRTYNDKKRKWEKFKRQNPAAADGPLRARFYREVLTREEREKLLPAIKNSYLAEAWKGWDVPHDNPEKWADENYNYLQSKLVYLSQEMHLRKVMADAFEGVTFFHYTHFFDTLNQDESVFARQCAIGGVAAVSMTADLGLQGAFLVWDHPLNMQRQVLTRTMCERGGTAPQGVDGHTGSQHGNCTFKDGNSTAVHEFGHFLHLPHASPTGGTREAAMHDNNDPKCIMNYDPDALHLCGGCALRLRGWAFYQDKGFQGFSNTTPGQQNPNGPPQTDTDALTNLFNNFYTDFA